MCFHSLSTLFSVFLQPIPSPPEAASRHAEPAPAPPTVNFSPRATGQTHPIRRLHMSNAISPLAPLYTHHGRVVALLSRLRMRLYVL